MFLALLINWGFERIPQKRAVTVLAIASLSAGLFFGIRLGTTNNILYFEQALAFSFFIHLGVKMRETLPVATDAKMPLWCCCLATIGAVAIFIALAKQVPLPWFGHHFSLAYSDIPLSLFLAVGGSFATFIVARSIKSPLLVSIAAELGKASLVIYFWHHQFLRLFWRMVPDEGLHSVVLALISPMPLCLTLASCWGLYKILSTRSLRWCLGHF